MSELEGFQIGTGPKEAERDSGELQSLIDEARKHPGEWVSAVFSQSQKSAIYKIRDGYYGDAAPDEFEVARRKLDGFKIRLYVKKVDGE